MDKTQPAASGFWQQDLIKAHHLAFCALGFTGKDQIEGDAATDLLVLIVEHWLSADDYDDVEEKLLTANWESEIEILLDALNGENGAYAL